MSAAQSFYFLGVDPAPALGQRSDDGALAALKATPRDPKTLSANPADWFLDYVWAYRLRGADVRQWSGLIHAKHRVFGFSGILLDAGAGGGGTYIMQELGKHQQLINGVEMQCRPICSPAYATSPDADFLLVMFMRGDEMIQQLWGMNLKNDSNLPDQMHVVSQQAVEHALFAFPKPFNDRPREETQALLPEEQWALKCLDAMRAQLQDIQVVTKENGELLVNSYQARKFEAGGKKDIAYAGLMAYVRFLIWLQQGAMMGEMEGGADLVSVW